MVDADDDSDPGTDSDFEDGASHHSLQHPYLGDEEMHALISLRTSINAGDPDAISIMPAAKVPPVLEDNLKTLFVYYMVISGLSLGITAVVAGDLACYHQVRRTIDPDYIEYGEPGIIDFSVWTAILVHCIALTKARIHTLLYRSPRYYDSLMTPNQESRADTSTLTRLYEGIRNMRYKDARKWIFNISETFLMEGSAIMTYQGIFYYLLTTELGLSAMSSWALAIGISTIELPALVLNMLAFLYEAEESQKAKPLDCSVKAQVITISTTTAVGSALNDAITFIQLYVTSLGKVLTENAATKISIYSAIVLVSLNALVYRMIDQWYPRLAVLLPELSKHLCGTANRERLDPGHHGKKNKEKSSFLVASEIMISVFKLITAFINVLSTLFTLMRWSIGEIGSLIVGSFIAAFVGICSMIAIAATYQKMPAKESNGSIQEQGVMHLREESPVPRTFSPGDALVLGPSSSYYTRHNPALLFRDSASHHRTDKNDIEIQISGDDNAGLDGALVQHAPSDQAALSIERYSLFSAGHASESTPLISRQTDASEPQVPATGESKEGWCVVM